MLNKCFTRNLYCLIGMGLLAAALVGCTSLSTDPQPAFEEVQNDVEERSRYDIYWKTCNGKDAAVEARLQTMLDQPLNAAQAVQIALLNNPRLQGHYEELGIAQAELVQAGLLKNPVFDLSLRFAEGASSNYILEMGVAKDFLDVLLRGVRIERAQAQRDITISKVVGEVMNLAAQTQIAFYSYQGAVQTYTTNQEILKATELTYEAAKRLHKAGNITDLSLATERSLHEQTKLELATSETVMLERRETLNTLMGLWGDQTGWRAEARLPAPPEETQEWAHLEQTAIANSLDLSAARQRMTVIAAEMGIETAELIFPEMAGGAEAEREGDGAWSAGPMISVGLPVFDFGQARTAAGEAHLRKLWNDYTALAIEIRSTARKVKYRLLNARNQVNYYKRVITPLAEQITLETQLQYNAMQLGVFQLLQAKRMEFGFKRNYIKALANYWIARTELELLLDGHLVRGTSVSMTAREAMMMSGNGH